MILKLNQSEASNLAFVMVLMRKDIKKHLKKTDKSMIKIYDEVLSDLEGVLETLNNSDINTLASIELSTDQAIMTSNFINWYLLNKSANKIIENDFISLKEKISRVGVANA